MYKTVRHGENSLQYTILPQTEEVLNNSGMKGKGRDYSPSIHVRRSRRSSTVKCVSVITFGIIIAFAIASMFYVISIVLFSHKGQRGHHEFVNVMRESLDTDLVKSRKKELKILPVMASTLTVKTEISSTAASFVSTSTISPAVTSDTVTLPPWTSVATKSIKSSTASLGIRPAPTENSIHNVATSGSNRFVQNDPSMKSWDKDIIIRPTVTTEPIKSKPFYPLEKSTVNNTKVFDDVLITTKSTTSNSPITTDFAMTAGSNLKDAIFAMDDNEDFNESIEVDDVFSLPSLKPDTADAVSDSDEVTIARWPFVDISSYFPWTGYSIGDNLLLPLLIAALSSIALVLILALAIRRRKRSHAASAQIGKLTADLQADDNTKLLTPENVEDAEE